MTVISAVISQHYCAHASDSFLTILKDDGVREIVENERTKLVHVPRLRGALAYFGLAQIESRGKVVWSTLDWLKQQAQKTATSTPEEFAQRVAVGLNTELAKYSFKRERDKGIGIHFTTYERVKDYWVPELFLISNWVSPLYADIRPNGIGVSRETYHTVTQVPPAPEHRNVEFRTKVHEVLHSGKMLIYNNGDPELFNPVAQAMLQNIGQLVQRGLMKAVTSDREHCAVVRRPIETVSKFLSDFTTEDKRWIGGKLHDLCVSPGGICWSSSGDCSA
jgi:hypothetical protein